LFSGKSKGEERRALGENRQRKTGENGEGERERKRI
jgi:hypothetical protein